MGGYVRIIQIARNRKVSKYEIEWSLIFESNVHQSSVWKIKWNITGNVLLSAGDDAKIYLWKRCKIKNDDCKYEPICISDATKTKMNKNKNKICLTDNTLSNCFFKWQW